jgi:adenine-specific DNA-methyltransferase
MAGPFVAEATIAPVQPLETDGDGGPTEGDVSTHIQRMASQINAAANPRHPRDS